MMAFAIIALIVVAIVIGVRFTIGLYATPYVPPTQEEQEAHRKAAEDNYRNRMTSRVLDVTDANPALIAEAIEKNRIEEKRRQAERRQHILSDLARFDPDILREAFKIAKAPKDNAPIPLYDDRVNALDAKNDGEARS